MAMRPVTVAIDDLQLKVKISNPVRHRMRSEELALGNCEIPSFDQFGKKSYRFRTNGSITGSPHLVSKFVNDNHPLPASKRPWGQTLLSSRVDVSLSLAFAQLDVKPDYAQLDFLWECYWYLYWMDVWEIVVDAEFTAGNGATAKGKIRIPERADLKLMATPRCCDDVEKIWLETAITGKMEGKDSPLIQKLGKAAKDHVEPPYEEPEGDLMEGNPDEEYRKDAERRQREKKKAAEKRAKEKAAEKPAKEKKSKAKKAAKADKDAAGKRGKKKGDKKKGKTSKKAKKG